MVSATDLVMEHRPATSSAQRPTNVGIKSILFHVHEDDGMEQRLQTALSLARACSAHLDLVQIVPIEAYSIVDCYGGTFVSGQIVEALEEQAATTRSRLEERLRNEDVSWSYRDTTAATAPELLRAAALSDLLVIGRQPSFREFGSTGPSLLGELVCNARTPLLIPGGSKDAFDPFGTAVVAWNGSVEAANAVRMSLGLLSMASEVRVVRYSEDKDLAFPDTRLVKYLAHHGIAALLDEKGATREIASDLVSYAGANNAAYLVIGGYSRSRVGEFLFGGVTRDLLGACSENLVMAH